MCTLYRSFGKDQVRDGERNHVPAEKLDQLEERDKKKKMKSDLNACEDFFDLVVTGHIIACVMEMLGMSSVDAVPSSNVIQSPDEVWMRDDSRRKSVLMEMASQIIDQNVDLSCTFADSQSIESTRAS